MGWAEKIGDHSIARQAALRLVFSLGLFVLVLGLSTAWMYRVTLEKAAHERAEDLVTYYRTRLAQLDREWELQARDFRVRIEYTRILEHPATASLSLQAFMTVQGSNRPFRYLLIQDRMGKKVFDFGKELDLEVSPLPRGLIDGWYLDRPTGTLYRVYEEQIWLGEKGMGRMALFFQVDNALLYLLANPGVTLTVFQGDVPVASSAGQAGIDRVRREGLREGDVEQRDIAWEQRPEYALVRLHVSAPVKALFSATELTVAASLIPVLDGMILWFALGTWLIRQARRIRGLGQAVETFSASRRITATMQEQLDQARAGRPDEIGQVAKAVQTMAWQTTLRDQEKVQEEAQRRLWAMVFSNSGEAIVITDSQNRIVTVNRAFTQLTGYGEDEVRGQDPKILSAGREGPEFYAQMWRQLVATGYWSGEVHDRRKDGSIYPKWLNIAVVHDGEGNVTHYLGTFADISARKEAEERILHIATHDTLTGLPNRQMLGERLGQYLTMAKQEDQRLAVLFLDLDNFKWVNDSLGHASGDQLLVAVAERLKKVVRGTDTVCRLGGDEFVVLLPGAGDSRDIARLAGKIIEAVAQPLELKGYDFHVTTSIGISLYPDDGLLADELLQHADTAMYAAKTAGRNQYHFFDASMNQHAIQRLELEQGLRQAFQNGEFELFYQPKANFSTGLPCGVEALIRWRHPTYGLIPPARFIPIAEDTGFIIPLGEWVIRRACEQIRQWQAEGVPVHAVAVNLAAVQLESDTFVESVERILAETGVEARRLEFELTETMVLRHPKRSEKTLTRLRELGVRLSLDDFGTGYSTLSYLHNLPVDTLKIDRSFVKGLPDEKGDSQIVRMIIALAKSIGLVTVAEGIETEAQRAMLAELGCDLMQGYLFAHPMPPEEYAEWLRRHPAPPVGMDCLPTP